MRDWIHTEDLFCENDNAVVLCEYKEELDLLRELIEMAEEAVSCKKNLSLSSSDGVCFRFAKSIVGYAKSAYDNMLLGHFSITKMIIRAMVENNVFLDIFMHDEKDELWKYYLVQSYRTSMKKFRGHLSRQDKETIEELYREYNIDKRFYEKVDKKSAYIDRPYGWLYTQCDGYKLEDVCALVNSRDYDDFKMMSDYSHGTAIYQKIFDGTGIESIMNMISSIYIGIDRLVKVYCWEYVDDVFDKVVEKLNDKVRGEIGLSGDRFK